MREYEMQDSLKKRLIVAGIVFAIIGIVLSALFIGMSFESDVDYGPVRVVLGVGIACLIVAIAALSWRLRGN